MRSKFSKIALAVILGIALAFTFSCSDDSGGGSGIGSSSYPYTEYEMEYLGFKSGLNSASSQESFYSALVEVVQEYLESHPDDEYDDEEFVLDGVTYYDSDYQAITGGVPTEVWNTYYEELKKYSYGIGSCWGFVYGTIPSKGKNGTLYVLYTIITSSKPETLYVAYRGNLIPKNKASLAKNSILQLPNETEIKVDKHILSKWKQNYEKNH